jgi:ribonuclease HII
MTKELQSALDAAQITYENLKEIADGITSSYVNDLDEEIREIQENIVVLTNDDLRNHIAKVSTRAYFLADARDNSTLCSTVSETLRKEVYANTFLSAEGTQGVKDSKSLLATQEQTLTEAIYDLVNSRFKTKVDESHRIVDSLKTLLTSRLSEMKMTKDTENYANQGD